MIRHLPTLLAVCVGLAAPALAGDIQWTNVGPGGGGWIQSIACDARNPEVIYLGCDVGGFYLSTDGGRSWTIHNEGLTDYFVECLAVDPEDSRIILLGMEGGIFKSTDGGKTWASKREGFPEPQRYGFSAPIGALCFDPTRPNVVYAGIGRPRRGKDGKGRIYKSEDCGETWTRTTPEGALEKDCIVSDIEVSPNGAYVLAATTAGVYRSEDEGKTWSACNDGLTHPDPLEVAIAPSDPSIVYCTIKTTARNNAPWNGGVCRSEDGGKTWAARNEGLAQRVGKSTQPGPMTSNYKEIVVDPRDPNVVYVGGTAWVSPGVYKTQDGGLHWSWSSRHAGNEPNTDRGWIGFWGPSVTCMALCAAKPDRLVFGTSGQLYLTDDRGETWEQRYCGQFEDGRFTGNGLEVTCMFDIVPDPLRANRVYFCFYDIGLLVSDDRGETFRLSREGMDHKGNCFTVVVDPDKQGRLWACTGQWGSNIGDVCRSDDDGETWSVVGKPQKGLPSGQTRSLVLDPTSPVDARVLYVTCNGHGIYKSEDAGDTWKPVTAGLPQPAVKSPCRLVMDPANPAHLRVALGGNPLGGSGVYETTSGGANWVKVSENAPFADLKDFVADPEDFNTLYVCQREKYDRSLDPPVMFPGGLFKSVDAGKTWARVYEYHFAQSVAVSPVDGNVLYLGTNDHPYHDGNWAQGVLKSSDGGKTWAPEVDGLSCWNISCVRVDPHDPARLYIGVGGNGGFVGTDKAIRP